MWPSVLPRANSLSTKSDFYSVERDRCVFGRCDIVSPVVIVFQPESTHQVVSHILPSVGYVTRRFSNPEKFGSRNIDWERYFEDSVVHC